MAFHAHPDDEAISTGGVLARYSAAGEQVVVVTATDGAEGEIHNYDDPEEIKPLLAEYRAREVRDALDALGVKHHEFLGYRDSGMMGADSNENPEAFWQSDFMDATGRLVRLIRSYQPEVMIVYDPFGGYGHPDHINVHRVGLAAWQGATDLGRFSAAGHGEAWAVSKLYWTTWPRSRIRQFAQSRMAAGDMTQEEFDELSESGTPDEDIHTWIDVSDRLDQKEKALRAHRTQIPDDWFLLSIPDELKPHVLGTETFVRVFSRVTTTHVESDLFAGLR